MIEYFVTQNLPLCSVLVFYLFYIWILLEIGFHTYFYVDIDIKYEKKKEARLRRVRLEVKYTDFIYGVKEINKFYKYWRVV